MVLDYDGDLDRLKRELNALGTKFIAEQKRGLQKKRAKLHEHVNSIVQGHGKSFKDNLQEKLKDMNPRFVTIFGETIMKEEGFLFNFIINDEFKLKILDPAGQTCDAYKEFERIWALQPLRECHVTDIRQYQLPEEEEKEKYPIFKKGINKEAIWRRNRTIEELRANYKKLGKYDISNPQEQRDLISVFLQKVDDSQGQMLQLVKQQFVARRQEFFEYYKSMYHTMMG